MHKAIDKAVLRNNFFKTTYLIKLFSEEKNFTNSLRGEKLIIVFSLLEAHRRSYQELVKMTLLLRGIHNIDSIIESKVIYYFEQCGPRV